MCVVISHKLSAFLLIVSSQERALDDVLSTSACAGLDISRVVNISECAEWPVWSWVWKWGSRWPSPAGGTTDNYASGSVVLVVN